MANPGGVISIYYVRRGWWSPVDQLIRWALPRTRFAWARASHSIVSWGQVAVDATMLHGVRARNLSDALKGHIVVDVRCYWVPDVESAKRFAQAQVGKGYDFKGAFGIALDPEREWLEDDKWFCHELSGATLWAGGYKLLRKVGHVTDTHLLMLNERAMLLRGPETQQ